MCNFPKGSLSGAISLALVLSVHSNSAAAQTSTATDTVTSAAAAAATPTNTGSTLGTEIVVPGVYESTISAIGALATGATGALKTARSDARTLAIRTALSLALNKAGSTTTSITLSASDDNSNSPLLGESAMLCNPHRDYVPNSIYLNYLNTLVQNIDTVSAKPPAPTDILSAVKLMFSSSGYAITDSVDLTKISDRQATAVKNCQTDLSSYEQAFYGTTIGAAGPAPTPAAQAAGAGVDTFAFLGPIGAAIDTFLSILQPVLIQASQLVDEEKRFAAIKTALDSNEDKIKKTGNALAAALDNFASVSRFNLVGSFVEQLVIIRDTKIDLTNVDDCKHLSPSAAPSSGKSAKPPAIPKSGPIGCFAAAWAKIQPLVTNLNNIGDNYDTAADNNTLSASKRFATIMGNFDKYKNGAQQQFFLNEITEFVAFATSVYNAASKSNITALKSAIAAAAK